MCWKQFAWEPFPSSSRSCHVFRSLGQSSPKGEAWEWGKSANLLLRKRREILSHVPLAFSEKRTKENGFGWRALILLAGYSHARGFALANWAFRAITQIYVEPNEARNSIRKQKLNPPFILELALSCIIRGINQSMFAEMAERRREGSPRRRCFQHVAACRSSRIAAHLDRNWRRQPWSNATPKPSAPAGNLHIFHSPLETPTN